MQPQFCAKDGVLDVDRLRMIADLDAEIDPTYVATVTAGIQAWAIKLGVSIVNLNLSRAVDDPTQYVIKVGRGMSAPDPQKTLEISYVGHDGGYFFIKNKGTEASHEFGHLLGLADRYFEGYLYEKTLGAVEEVAGTRVTVSMSEKAFPDEHDYDPATNIMARSNGMDFSVTAAQVERILSCHMENPAPRHVVGVFESKAKSGPYALPSSMYLDGNQLKTAKSPFDQKVAGYSTRFGGRICQPRADEVPNGNDTVLELWRKRSKFDEDGNRAIKIVRRGSLYRGRRVARNGVRIHRRRMSLIAAMTGE